MKLNKFNVFVFVSIAALVIIGRLMDSEPNAESRLAIEQAKANASMEKAKEIKDAADEQLRVAEKARTAATSAVYSALVATPDPN